jgi:hypothetical protein
MDYDGDNGDGATDDDVDVIGNGDGAMDDDNDGDGVTDDDGDDGNSDGVAADDDVDDENLPPRVGKRGMMVATRQRQRRRRWSQILW